MAFFRHLLDHDAPSAAPVRIARVRVGIVDVGANTVRLLVASAERGSLAVVREDRVQLGLGEDIERRGEIGDTKLNEAAATAKAHVRRAWKLGANAVDVLVTSPGRQARNGEELARRVASATRAPTRVLAPEEEAELAWRGAVNASADFPETVAVCDVGGGSTQIAVGSATGNPSWVRSVDIGSLRLTRRAFRNDPPDAEDVARAGRILAAEFARTAPPLPLAAIAVGGTARALRKVVGNELTEESLLLAIGRLSKKGSKKIAKDYGVPEVRARTMTAGALVFLEIERRLAVGLKVGRGGIREGAALALLAEAEAAARSAYA
jgi:exopolyphosphatase / guanosine-5'-triphosphate,3'-diphosphate pyrophosphatase